MNPPLILFSYRHDQAYSQDTSRTAIRAADSTFIQENLAILSETSDPLEAFHSAVGALGISAKRTFEDTFGQVYPREMAPVQEPDVTMAEADSTSEEAGPPAKRARNDPTARGMISSNADGGGSFKLYSAVPTHNNTMPLTLVHRQEVYMRTPKLYDGWDTDATTWVLLPWLIPDNLFLPISTVSKYRIKNVHFRMSNLIMTTDSLVSTGGTLGSVTSFANTVPLNVYTDKMGVIENLDRVYVHSTRTRS